MGRTSAERGFTFAGGPSGVERKKRKDEGRRGHDGMGRTSAEKGFTFEGDPSGLERDKGKDEG